MEGLGTSSRKCLSWTARLYFTLPVSSFFSRGREAISSSAENPRRFSCAQESHPEGICRAGVPLCLPIRRQPFPSNHRMAPSRRRRSRPSHSTDSFRRERACTKISMPDTRSDTFSGSCVNATMASERHCMHHPPPRETLSQPSDAQLEKVEGHWGC